MIKKTKYYFCYGSNLNVEQMDKRCPAAIPMGKAILADFRLEFWNVATIVPDTGYHVQGGLWKITPECEKALDIYEGYPRLYEKKIVKVKDHYNKTVEAMTYFMVGMPRPAAPSLGYYNTIKRGYTDFGLNVDVLDWFIKHQNLKYEDCL